VSPGAKSKTDVMAERADICPRIAPDPDQHIPINRIKKFDLMDDADPEVSCYCTFPWGPLIDPAGEFRKDLPDAGGCDLTMNADKTDIFLLF